MHTKHSRACQQTAHVLRYTLRAVLLWGKLGHPLFQRLKVPSFLRPTALFTKFETQSITITDTSNFASMLISSVLLLWVRW